MSCVSFGNCDMCDMTKTLYIDLTHIYITHTQIFHKSSQVNPQVTCVSFLLGFSERKKNPDKFFCGKLVVKGTYFTYHEFPQEKMPSKKEFYLYSDDETITTTHYV